MLSTEKRCNKCGVVKSVDEFHRRRRGKGGRRAQCKDCVNPKGAAGARKAYVPAQAAVSHELVMTYTGSRAPVIHRTDCSCADLITKPTLSVPDTVKVRLCQTCKPDQADLAEFATRIEWTSRRNDALAKALFRDLDEAEDRLARKELGVGKVVTRNRRLSSV